MLPTYALIPGAVLATLVFGAALGIAKTAPARFVVCAIWMRLILSAFHEHTFPKIAAGLSINALFSALVVAVGLLVVRKTLLLSKGFLPLYLLIAVTLLSAFANARIGASVDILIKYCYFLAIAIATYQALQSEDRRFGLAAILAFSPLVIFQAVSLLLGISKTASDGSIGYIGGYNHEAAFSVALAAMFLVACLASGVRLSIRAIAMGAATIGIMLANYRTAIIGVLPLAGYALLAASGRWFEPRLRRAVVLKGMVFGGFAIAYGLGVSDRFADVGDLLRGDVPLFAPPESFTAEERSLLTGRAYLWSAYVHSWAAAGPLHQLLGFGPDAWEAHFALYAHNSFVGVLFDYGVLGFGTLSGFLATGFAMAARSRQPWRLMAAHLSFLLLNFATMPFWQIEGLILYGYLWGHTMAARSGRRTDGIDHPRYLVPMRGTPRLARSG
ncbi:MAG: hypothetical protein AAGE05_08920 [Pseudomonadota bacterium]